MNLAEERAIRDKTAALVLDWADHRQPQFTGETSEGFAEAIVVAHVVADEAKLNLHRWIDAARRTGVSWAEIGEALGISKQAAQQRFRPDEEAEDPSKRRGEEVVRIGATAFNEMNILRAEGRKGNELIRTGALKLVFRPTSRAWEYQRRLGAAPPTSTMEKDGWIYVSSWMPFHYFKRPAPPE